MIQTELINKAKEDLEFANNCCLALCYAYIDLYLRNLEITNTNLYNYIMIYKEKGWILKNAYVLRPDLIFNHRAKVYHSNNNQGYKLSIAMYQYKEYTHFVVVNDLHEIVFNSLDHSNCVELGSIANYRIVECENLKLN